MKDPAFLFYSDKFYTATAGMHASFRGWYIDLLVYQYDNGCVPNDEDQIAGICRVRPSEYDLFKQMLKQVLKQKFKQTESGWINTFAEEITVARSNFKEKRSKSGTIGAVVKLAKSIPGYNDAALSALKKELYSLSIEEIKLKQNKQVLKQMLKLYVNVIVNVNKDISIDKREILIERSKKFKTELIADEISSNLIRMNLGLSPDEYSNKVDSFINFKTEVDELGWSDYPAFRKNFRLWLNKNSHVTQSKRPTTDSKQSSAQALRSALPKRRTG